MQIFYQEKHVCLTRKALEAVVYLAGPKTLQQPMGKYFTHMMLMFDNGTVLKKDKLI